MSKYIDADKLIAEIKRRKNDSRELAQEHKNSSLEIIGSPSGLAKNEDERIRKAIEGAIRVYGKTQGEWLCGYDMDTLVVRLREAFGALEKQKREIAMTRGGDEISSGHILYTRYPRS